VREHICLPAEVSRLECSVACGECRCTSCSNSSAVQDEDIDDTDFYLMLKKTSQN